MSKKLVAYFSASGVTARAAKTLADAVGADLFEIVPKERYTPADLDWRNKQSRSSVEMNDPDCRPPIKDVGAGIDGYDTVFVGFPIWWYVAPRIINTFLESCDLSGKTIIPFATSGGSGMERVNGSLLPSCRGARLLDGKLFSGNADKSEFIAWQNTLSIS